MEHSMISIGTHRLAYTITGRSRAPNEPLVVAIAGVGEVTSTFAAVESHAAPYVRMFFYDRSGLGHSERGPNPPYATTAAKELHSLLQATEQHPPYVLLAHSFGGVIAREFLHFYPDEVGGMVLLDAVTEMEYDFFQWPNPNIEAVLGDLNSAVVTGLRADSKLTREQWRQRASDMARGVDITKEEIVRGFEMCRNLAGHKQFELQALGDKPLSVVRCNAARDYERVYAAGVKAGNGTEAQRKEFRRLLKGWDVALRYFAMRQLELSSRTRYVDLPDCGHNVQLVRPDVVTEEIRWVVDQMRRPRTITRL